MWYLIVGNGHLLELRPLCNDTWGTVTLTILSGDDCDSLTCLIQLQDFNFSCSSTDCELRGGRVLESVEPFEFQTHRDVIYWIFLDGPPKSELYDAFPFTIIQKGIPPSGQPSSQPSMGPSVAPSTLTPRPSRSHSEHPSLIPPAALPGPAPTVITELPTRLTSEENPASSEGGGLPTGALVGIILCSVLLLVCCYALFTMNRSRHGLELHQAPDMKISENEKIGLAFQDEEEDEAGWEDEEDDDGESDVEDDDNDGYRSRWHIG
jgi:hypothetical protein